MIYHSSCSIISLIALTLFIGKIIGGVCVYFIQKKYIEELERELDTKNDIINNYSLKK